MISYIGTDINFMRGSQGRVFYISSAAKRYPDLLYESTVFRTKCKDGNKNMKKRRPKYSKFLSIKGVRVAQALVICIVTAWPRKNPTIEQIW
jgi:hypothetical protein